PGAAVTLLELDATGLDRLIASCGELGRALEAGPAGWNRPNYHMMLMALAGHRLDENPHYAGGLPAASARLLAANDAEFAAKPCFDYGYLVVVHPLPEDEHGAAAETLRRAIAEQLERLREMRRKAAEPDDLRRRAVAAAYADGTEEGKLRHRYEMAIDRSLRATIAQLIMLEKSGADLGGDGAGSEASGWQGFACEPRSSEASGTGVGERTSAVQSTTEVYCLNDVATNDGPAQRASEPAAPGSLGDGEAGSVPTPSAAPIHGPTTQIPLPPRAGRRRSRR
ncbi:MAG TPA: hypothetical protein VGH33_25800, partial [Isosphaeraceae bacterium]